MGCLEGRPMHNQLMTLNGFKVIKETKMAQGGYGEVWKCRGAGSETLYALKEIRLQSEELKTMYRKESRILAKLKEKGLKGSVGLVQEVVEKRKEGEVGCLLFEFGTITLFDEIVNNGFSTKDLLQRWLVLVQCVKELHQIGVVHLDIKPQNFIMVKGQYKLCDFGSALEKAVDYDKLSRKERLIFEEYLEGNCTLHYRSPEMVDPIGKVIGEPSDVWMLGCIAFLMTHKKHPFQEGGKLAILTPLQYPTQHELNPLIQSMLTLDPAQRPTATQLQQKIKALLQGLG